MQEQHGERPGPLCRIGPASIQPWPTEPHPTTDAFSREQWHAFATSFDLKLAAAPGTAESASAGRCGTPTLASTGWPVWGGLVGERLPARSAESLSGKPLPTGVSCTSSSATSGISGSR
jgi:hypothetical protein